MAVRKLGRVFLSLIYAMSTDEKIKFVAIGLIPPNIDVATGLVHHHPVVWIAKVIEIATPYLLNENR